ncbi:MAG: sugar phosphate isomerase/epimerase, partial [Parabacteroides sp.]|nr:sugar phosphate isomerase/epimerase [Parabacteroides sp.]
MIRRDFLKNISLMTAGGLLAGKASAAVAATGAEPAPMPNASKSFGLQIYSLQQELYNDLPARLKEVKAMGYERLELAGYGKGKIGKVDMMEFKKMAEDAGLKIVSSHVNPSVEGVPFVRDYTKELTPKIMEYWKATAADHAKLGCKYLIQPMMPNIPDHDAAKLVCDVFNQAADVIKAEGIATGFGYHNHNMEFNRVATEEQKAKMKGNPFAAFMKVGDQIYDLMLRDTDPSKVYFEMDVYWTVMGQNDPVEYMQKHKDRIKVLHIKDRAVFGQSG